MSEGLSTRQLARRAARDRQKRVQAVIASGLSLEPSERELLDLTAAVAEALARDGDAGAVRRAAKLAHQLNDNSLRRSPFPGTLACRAGCAYCCHANRVAVTAPEAFLLAASVTARAKSGAIPRFREAAARVAGLDENARIASRLPCPLLEDGRCTVYDARPITCRQTTSVKVEMCIDEFEGRNLDKGVEGSPQHAVHSGHAQMLLLAGLAANGFPVVRYELGAAVLRVLDSPDAERRWLDGEGIFDGLEPIGGDERAIAIARLLARRAGWGAA